MELAVFAHPREDSLCGQVMTRFAGSRPVAIADLYRDGFSPVMPEGEFAAYGQPSDDPLVAKYQRQIAEATSVAFVFPVWMYGLPAILKGYFDRVWTPGATFAFRDGVPAGLLGNLKTIRVMCTFGQPRAFYERSSDPVLLFFVQLMSQNCESPCTIEYQPLFGTDRIEARAVADYLDRVSAGLGRA